MVSTSLATLEVVVDTYIVLGGRRNGFHELTLRHVVLPGRLILDGMLEELQTILFRQFGLCDGANKGLRDFLGDGSHLSGESRSCTAQPADCANGGNKARGTMQIRNTRWVKGVEVLMDVLGVDRKFEKSRSWFIRRSSDGVTSTVGPWVGDLPSAPFTRSCQSIKLRVEGKELQLVSTHDDRVLFSFGDCVVELLVPTRPYPI